MRVKPQCVPERNPAAKPFLRSKNTDHVGDFFVCGSDEEGNLTSLSEEELDTYTKLFYEPQEFTKEEIEETAVIEFYTFE